MWKPHTRVTIKICWTCIIRAFQNEFTCIFSVGKLFCTCGAGDDASYVRFGETKDKYLNRSLRHGTEMRHRNLIRFHRYRGHVGTGLRYPTLIYSMCIWIISHSIALIMSYKWFWIFFPRAMLWDGGGAISLTDQWRPGTWSEVWTPCTDERMQSGVPAMSVSVVRCSPSAIWMKNTSFLKCPIPQKGRVSLRPPSSAFRGDSSSDNVDAALHTNTTVKSSRFCWH